MKKSLLLALFVGIAALAAAKRARAAVGDPCVTEDGFSGYIYASGITGDEICVADGH